MTNPAVGDEQYISGDANTDGSTRFLWVADTNGDGLPDAKLQARVGGAWIDMVLPTVVAEAARATTAEALKANLAGATFTGPVVVPDATLAGQAVTLGQLRGIGWASVADPLFSGGAKGDGSTDDAAAFAAGVAWLRTNFGGGRLLVPRPAVYYRTLTPIYLSDYVILELLGGARIRNECASSIWNCVPVIMGTYAGWGSSGYANLDTGWTIGAVTRPTNAGTMQTHAQAGNLAAGDLVYIVDTAATTNGYYDRAESNIVDTSDASSGIVTFVYPLAFDYTAGTFVRKLGRVGVKSALATGEDGLGAYAVRGAGIRGDGTIEQAQSGYKAIHLGGSYECFVEGVKVVGWVGINGNPICHCRIKSSMIEYNGTGAIELAYGSNGNLIEGVDYRRTGSTNPNATFQFAIHTGSEDGGADNTIRFGAGQEFVTTSSDQGLVSLLGDRDRVFRHRIVSANCSGVAGITATGPDSAVEECEAEGCKLLGVQAAGARARVLKNKVRGVPAVAGGISIASTATNGLVEDNRVGDPDALTTRDTIVITPATAVQRRNRSYDFGWPGVNTLNNNEYTGSSYTSLSDITSFVVPGGQCARGRILRIRHAGYVDPAKGAGAKTLTITWNGVTCASLVLADTYTGLYELEVVCVAQQSATGAAQGWTAYSRTRTTGGEVVGTPVSCGGTFGSDTTGHLKLQLATIASSISSRLVQVSLDEP